METRRARFEDCTLCSMRPNGPAICLAQPIGLGIENERPVGPTARSFVIARFQKTNCRAFGPTNPHSYVTQPVGLG